MSEHSQGQNTAGHWAEEGCWNKQTILLLRFHSGSTFQVRDPDPDPDPVVAPRVPQRAWQELDWSRAEVVGASQATADQSFYLPQAPPHSSTL